MNFSVCSVLLSFFWSSLVWCWLFLVWRLFFELRVEFRLMKSRRKQTQWAQWIYPAVKKYYGIKSFWKLDLLPWYNIIIRKISQNASKFHATANPRIQKAIYTRLITLETKYFWRINGCNWHFFASLMKILLALHFAKNEILKFSKWFESIIFLDSTDKFTRPIVFVYVSISWV